MFKTTFLFVVVLGLCLFAGCQSSRFDYQDAKSVVDSIIAEEIVCGENGMVELPDHVKHLSVDGKAYVERNGEIISVLFP